MWCAIEDLKADVIASLRARLDVLLDEAGAAEEDDDENTDGRSRGPAARTLSPRAVRRTRRCFCRFRVARGRVEGRVRCVRLPRRESPRPTSSSDARRCSDGTSQGAKPVKIAEATPAPRDGEASRGVGGDRRERRPSNLTSSLRDGPTTGGRGRDAPDAWKTSRAGAASSGASMALAALGAGAALVAAGLANLAVSTPECVGEMCERAMGG